VLFVNFASHTHIVINVASRSCLRRKDVMNPTKVQCVTLMSFSSMHFGHHPIWFLVLGLFCFSYHSYFPSKLFYFTKQICLHCVLSSTFFHTISIVVVLDHFHVSIWFSNGSNFSVCHHQMVWVQGFPQE
jgi:hypothetical protein